MMSSTNRTDKTKACSESGIGLFIVLLAIVLFIGLASVVSKSLSVREDSGARERAKLDTAVNDDCEANVNNAIIRLRLVNDCQTDQISYELPSGANANLAAPSDKSCHLFNQAGAGLSPCGTYATVIAGDVTPNAVNWTDMVEGDDCTDAAPRTQTISGIDSAIQLRFTYAGSGLTYRVNGGTAQAISGTAVTSVSDGDAVTFTSIFSADGPVTITNISDGDVTLDTFTILYTFTGGSCSGLP